MTKKERFEKVIHYFQTERPIAETELEYGSPYELLVAVILSAQCTDKRVNLTTPAFFAAFPTSEVLAASSPEEVFPYIRSISYPNNKAKHLVGMAKVLVEEFNNIVPSDIDELRDCRVLVEKLPMLLLPLSTTCRLWQSILMYSEYPQESA